MPLSPTHRRWPALFARAAYGVMAAATFAGALYLWNLHCENFGCIGLGLAWAMWVAVLYLPALLAGAWLARRRPGQPPPALRHVHRAVLVLGAGLAGAWAWLHH